MEENPNRRAKYGFVDVSIPIFNLPNDVSVHIFLKLPFKSIICCLSVCKQWRIFLSNPDFARMHLNHHSTNSQKFLLRSNFQSFYCVDYHASKRNCDIGLRNFPLKTRRHARIYGSCNGLLCVAIDHKKEGCLNNYKIILWNPSTGDYKMLPDANPLIETNGYNPNYFSTYVYRLVGFGYDSFSEDYKMIRAILRPRYQVDVYSLKTNSWKVIECTAPIRFGFSIDAVGTAVNGTIYWLLGDYKRGKFKFDRWIVGFDLKDDKFIELPFPPCNPPCWYNLKLRVVGGCLGVYCLDSEGYRYFLVLWVMKEDKKDKWTKLTTISFDERKMNCRYTCLQPLHLFENGEVFFYKADFDNKIEPVALLVYDTKVNNIVKTIPLHGISRSYDLVTYTESLVSPNAWVARMSDNN